MSGITRRDPETGMTTHYEVMSFPGEGIDGGWAYNVRISSGDSYWTSPLVKLALTDEAAARAEIGRQVRMLIEGIVGSGEESCDHG